MSDMAWVKLDDGFFRNPKVVGVGRDAKILFVAGLCYSGSALTDGFIPTNAPRLLAADAEVTGTARAVRELVAAGLWEAVDGGYMIHDYLEFNQSAEKVRANKDAARDRMQRNRSQDVRANNPQSSREVREQDKDRDRDTDSPMGETPIPPPDGHPASGPDPSELRFERFWSAYPLKVGKKPAREAWNRLKPDDAMTGKLIAAVAEQSRSEAWAKEHGKYIPHPTTWLRQDRWTDIVPVSIANGTDAAKNSTPHSRTEDAFETYFRSMDGGAESELVDAIDVTGRVS